MLPEQEQHILGYFIEEAKDHLNTIEQGLLNLQQVLKDPEMVNEIFRAAHSIKGGAAMLGLNSIQQTAHHLEDYFKILQESDPLCIDQKLESLLLRVFDTLQELLEQLQSPFGLSPEVANRLMSEVEPVFAALHQRLRLLVPPTPQHSAVSALSLFQSYVLLQLRQMLSLFKQTETPESRQQLQECCQKLILLGQKFNLPGWCNLCQTASEVIGNQENSYRTLAPMVIKELKQSHDLIIAGQGAKIKTSDQMQTLLGQAITTKLLASK